MTRPQIIRADTIDLQDKLSPTAQDHFHQPEHPAPYGIGPAAPHQQAAVRHVEEERRSEETRLQKLWSTSETNLRGEPGCDDEHTFVHRTKGQRSAQHDEQAVGLNGDMSVERDDADMQDADIEDDLDDDLMDKISSSPSIDDGGYSQLCHHTMWPMRRESLTRQSSPLRTNSADSSPYTSTPPHLPIAAVEARGQFNVSAYDSFCSSSKTIQIPSPPPSSQPFPSKPQSTEHHQCEYAGARMASRIISKDNGRSSISPQRHYFHVSNHGLSRTDSTDSHTSSDIGRNQNGLPRSPSNLTEDPFFESSSIPSRTGADIPSPEAKYRYALSEDYEDESWITDSDADSWEDHQNDDASDNFSFPDDPRFIDSGWGGECLREIEDIDFEFVYALHTFVATVEGQANATKGDTMVLLDDSNSYWWLVRVVKDSSIGYLPAEHIETPTERLARLNKHRNIDLSATMLGDNAEKSKNPLKKAMRRRNAKTVQFGAPTYVEASDYDYSSDEGDGELFGGPEPQQQQQQQAAQTAEMEQDDGLKVQPLKVNGPSDGKVQIEDRRASNEDSTRVEERQRVSNDNLDRPLDPKVSQNGTVRNTDSFFRDENTETRKITLTPNLLRDNSSNSTTSSRERGPSLESLEKNGFADKVKDKREKKEKKGMLSGLFKRKEKKAKGMSDSQDSDVEIMMKPDDVERGQLRAKQSEESLNRSSTDRPSTADGPHLAPQRQHSKGKLQKVQRARDDSPQNTKGILKKDSPTEQRLLSQAVTNEIDNKSQQQPSSTMRMVTPDQGSANRPPVEERKLSSENRHAPTMGSNNPFTKMIDHTSSPKPEQVKPSTERVQLDDFDSDEGSDPFADPGAQNSATQSTVSKSNDRLSESPVHISATDAQPGKASFEADKDHDSRQPPGLTHDGSSQETSSPISTPTLEDSPMKPIPEQSAISFRGPHTPPPTHGSKSAHVPTCLAPVPGKHEADRAMSPPISVDSAILPAWSDASLRAYLDDGSDIRDMLLVVNDTTGVVPVGRDHPFMKNLFVEETKKVAGLSGELDRLLNALLDKRRTGSGARGRGSAR